MTASSFEDHFSASAPDYAKYRPRYPAALFDWLASIAPGRKLAWDCATGSGQAAVGLAAHFERVVASDAAEAQVEQAEPADRVRYAVFPAECAELASRSVDLVTVAQALHWFELERFYAEVRRVLVPGGVVAAWSYALFRIEPQLDAVVDAWYRGPIDAYWPAGRRLVEGGYQAMAFPFERIEAPAFEMEAQWSLHEVLGYLGTWSAVKRYRDERGEDAVALIREELSRLWGEPEATRRVVWPVAMLVGR